MATYTEKVGRLAENAVRTFLAGNGYTVIPYGVEHTLKHVVALGHEAYSKLRLETVIASAPDFFVLSPHNQSYWLLEVKYRSGWSDLTRSGLKESFEPQTKCWNRIFALIAIKSPIGSDDLPASHIRGCQLFTDGGKLHVYTQGSDGSKDWDEVEWEDLCPIESIFSACCNDDDGKRRLSELVKAIREMPEDCIDFNLLRKAWDEVKAKR